jgi:hypothetical protein
MKIRTDFVTNSSSSSFIISKKISSDNLKEHVFQYIKKLFIEWRDKFKKVSDDYGFDIVQASWDKLSPITDEVKEKYGVDVYDSYCFQQNIDWLKCETYEEFEKYWSERNSGKEYPDWIFKIVNISDFDEGKRQHIIGWYFPCSYNGHCDKDWCCDYVKKENRETICPLVNKEKIEQTDVINLFGDGVCVCSESGYIPYSIVEKLSKLSDYYCNHMG